MFADHKFFIPAPTAPDLRNFVLAEAKHVAQDLSRMLAKQRRANNAGGAVRHWGLLSPPPHRAGSGVQTPQFNAGNLWGRGAILLARPSR